MFSKAIAVVVAMDKEVLHWHCIFSFAVSCFAIKFIDRGPKLCYKNRCWFFGISGPEKYWKSREFLSGDLSGNPGIQCTVNCNREGIRPVKTCPTNCKDSLLKTKPSQKLPLL